MLYRFEKFELDRDRFELRLNGVVLSVQPKTLEILFLLVENRDRLVTKDEIIEAIMWMDRALELNPNYAVAHGAIGNIYAFLGSTDRAEDHVSTAIALSPQDPWLHSLYAARAVLNMIDGNFDEAARWDRESMKLPHRDVMVMIAALCSNFVAGRKDDAAKIAQQIKKTHPHIRAAGIARVYPMMTSEYCDLLTKIMIANGFR